MDTVPALVILVSVFAQKFSKGVRVSPGRAKQDEQRHKLYAITKSNGGQGVKKGETNKQKGTRWLFPSPRWQPQGCLRLCSSYTGFKILLYFRGRPRELCVPRSSQGHLRGSVGCARGLAPRWARFCQCKTCFQFSALPQLCCAPALKNKFFFFLKRSFWLFCGKKARTKACGLDRRPGEK